MFDRRITETVNGVATRFAYDRQNSWADFNGNGSVAARYLLGTNVDENLARFRSSDGLAFYLADRLGTVRDIVNPAGVVINHIDYAAFGAILRQTNALAGDRFGFTGRELDQATGLYWLRARYYDTHLGRFITQDPIELAGADANLYRYVRNDPTDATDPTGTVTAIEKAVVRWLGSQIARFVIVYAKCLFWGLLVVGVILGPVSYAKKTPVPALAGGAGIWLRCFFRAIWYAIPGT